MPKQKRERGIFGLKKDPKNQILFFGNDEDWPSDDSEDSDYLPSDEDRKPNNKKRAKKAKKCETKRCKENNNVDLCCKSSVAVPPLPTEIWLKIFNDVVSTAGPLPFLSRAQKVCSQWRDIAIKPSLWKRIDLAFGWIKHKEETLKWLSENRLSQCEDINLSGWTLSNGFKVLTENCPHLQNVHLSNCKKLNVEGVMSLADNCKELVDVDFSGTGITSSALKDFLQKRCDKLKRIDISYNAKLMGFSVVFQSILKCPNLTVLDISNIENTPTFITIDIIEFHRSCPKMKILRMGNNRYKAVPKTDQEMEASPGFPELEEFRMYDLTEKNHMNEAILYDVFYGILHKAPKLKVLDIRGRCNEAISVIGEIPATHVESLLIGLQSTQYDVAYVNMLRKWRHSLKTLDMSKMQNVEIGIRDLISGPSSLIPLQQLTLTATNIEIKDLKSLLKKCPNLKYIQLESCRNLPRGIKRLYKDEDVELLKEKLKELK